MCIERSLSARQFEMPGIYLCIYKLTFEPRETDDMNNINKEIVYSMLESNKCSEEK